MKKEIQHKIKNYIKTEDGKKFLIAGIIGILIGLLWKVVLITVGIVGIVYLMNRRRMENKDKKIIKKVGEEK